MHCLCRHKHCQNSQEQCDVAAVKLLLHFTVHLLMQVNICLSLLLAEIAVQNSSYILLDLFSICLFVVGLNSQRAPCTRTSHLLIRITGRCLSCHTIISQVNRKWEWVIINGFRHLSIIPDASDLLVLEHSEMLLSGPTLCERTLGRTWKACFCVLSKRCGVHEVSLMIHLEKTANMAPFHYRNSAGGN